MKIGEYRLFARPRSRPIVIVHAVTNVDQIHRRRPKGVIYIKKPSFNHKRTYINIRCMSQCASIIKSRTIGGSNIPVPHISNGDINWIRRQSKGGSTRLRVGRPQT